MDNSYSGLKLPAGEHHINGVTFLEVLAHCENIGNDSAPGVLAFPAVPRVSPQRPGPR
jgi:hypothetical protein